MPIDLELQWCGVVAYDEYNELQWHITSLCLIQCVMTAREETKSRGPGPRFHRPCFGSHGLHQISAFPCTLLTIRAHTRTRTHVDCIATHTHTHAHMLTRMSKAVWNRSYSQRNKGYSPIYRIIIHKCNNTIPVCQIIFGVWRVIGMRGVRWGTSCFMWDEAQAVSCSLTTRLSPNLILFDTILKRTDARWHECGSCDECASSDDVSMTIYEVPWVDT